MPLQNSSGEQDDSPTHGKDLVSGESCEPIDDSSEPLRTKANDASDQVSASSIQLKVWNDAYKGLKDDNRKTMEKFEAIMRKGSASTSSTSSQNKEVVVRSEDVWNLMRRFVRSQVEKTEKLDKHLGTIENVARIAQSITELIKGPLESVPQAGPAIAALGLVLVSKLVANPASERRANRQGIVYVQKKLAWYWELSDFLLQDIDSMRGLGQNLRLFIVDLYQQFLLYQVDSVIMLQRNRALGWLQDMLKWKDWAGQLSEIQQAEQQVTQCISDYTQMKESQEKRDARNRECRDALGSDVPDPQIQLERMKMDKGGLNMECSEWLFHSDQFQTFLDKPEQQIFWITGDAGKGKTMLLCDVIERLKSSPDKTRRVFYYFCEARNSESELSKTAALRGLIGAIAFESDKYLDTLRKSLDKNQNAFKGVGSGVAIAARDTLRSILSDEGLKGAIICIDGLDECGQDMVHVLELVTENPNIKWVVSSRTGTLSVERKLRNYPNCERLSLEDVQPAVSGAVERFVRSKIKELAEHWNLKPTVRKMKGLQDELIKRAEGTFLWVALAFAELKNLRCFKSAPKILSRLPAGMHALYGRMLAAVLNSPEADIFKYILSLCLVAHRPLTVNEFPMFLSPESALVPAGTDLLDWKTWIEGCGNLLRISSTSETVSFIHYSAKQFLEEHARDTLPQSGIDQSIFTQSIGLMRNVLHRDMWRLRHPGAVKGDRPKFDRLESISYACTFWGIHLDTHTWTEISSCEAGELQGQILSFLSKHLLHWIEALSLLGVLSEGAMMLYKMRNFTVKYQMDELSEFLWDAYRFFLCFREPIAVAPLQVYASGIIFSPSTSQISKHFNHQYAQWATVTSSSHDISEWPSCLLLIEKSPVGYLPRLAYNQNGTRLLVADAGSIGVIDTITGARIRNFDLKEKFPLTSRISRDATKFASATVGEVGCLKLLDIVNESCIELPQELNNLTGLDFSYDLKMLAGVSGTYIKIWETEQGELVSRLTLESEPVAYQYPKFLGNSTMIAIPFINRNIEILEVQTGERCYELQTGFDIDHLVPYPRDSSKLIFITKKRELYQWNIGTREAVKMMDALVSECWGKIENVIVISPSERIVAVLGDELNLHILATSGHERLELRDLPFRGSLAFSHDGRLLAVSTDLGEIWVWNTASRTWTFRFDSHYYVLSLVFSPDAKYLASCGMHLPSTSMGMSLHTQIWPLEVPHRRGVEDEQYESRKISNVNLSPDNRWIATVSDKSKVSLWSSSGRFERHLENAGNIGVTALKFSWDSTKLAFLTEEGNVGIWDLKRACSMEINAFNYVDFPGPCLEFSRNDGLLAASTTEQLKVFDVRESNSQALKRKSLIIAGHSSTFKLKTTCECGQGMIGTACIALFGTWVAAGSKYANVILLWDVDTGQLINRIPLLSPSYTHQRTMDMRSIGGSTQILSSDSNARLMIMEVPSGHIVKTMRTPPLERIACNQDDHTQLFTNLGKIDLTQFDSGDSEDPNGVRFQGYGSSTDWVFKDGKRILWLPPDCRSHSISRNQIAIACPGGSLLCITFPDDISSFF
ncbi:Heterokaryon incompatibility protein [Metarhizium guizhouense ARSEF 977]|uniref:Heterokaryon incompatibility protein n=1 Tax=Metarhizium guizhouense (strain ARSEF 977) TaxID=1276136 RepID=A0A0B4GXF3_METGA|nr:Heterokaryon incompatibility protein [Metarhizium guizhouense ARSEF 977]